MLKGEAIFYVTLSEISEFLSGCQSSFHFMGTQEVISL